MGWPDTSSERVLLSSGTLDVLQQLHISRVRNKHVMECPHAMRLLRSRWQLRSMLPCPRSQAQRTSSGSRIGEYSDRPDPSARALSMAGICCATCTRTFILSSAEDGSNVSRRDSLQSQFGIPSDHDRPRDQVWRAHYGRLQAQIITRNATCALGQRLQSALHPCTAHSS